MRRSRTDGVFFDCEHAECFGFFIIHLLVFRSSQAVHKSPIETVENDKRTGEQEPGSSIDPIGDFLWRHRSPTGLFVRLFRGSGRRVVKVMIVGVNLKCGGT